MYDIIAWHICVHLTQATHPAGMYASFTIFGHHGHSWTIATLPTGTNDKRWLSLGRPVFQTIMLEMVSWLLG